MAVLIVLLHSIVPHHHHNRAEQASQCNLTEPANETGLINLLGDLFHVDLGADHLENLTQVVNSTVLIPVLEVFSALLFDTLGLSAIADQPVHGFISQEILPDAPCLQALFLRGPPPHVVLS